MPNVDTEVIIVWGMIIVIVLASLVSLIPKKTEPLRDVHIKVDWTYVEEDTWNLEIQLDGNDAFDVEFVEYILHPTFPNPIRKITNPSNNFLLAITAYGGFLVRAIVHFKDEKKQRLAYDLKLYPGPFGWGTKNWSKHEPQPIS